MNERLCSVGEHSLSPFKRCPYAVPVSYTHLFMNIITGKMMPDEGKVEWSKNVRVGYLDQHTVLEKGMTIRDVLKSAFSFLFEMEEKMNDICAKMGDASEEEMNAMMEELGTIQDLLMAHDFYIIDSKVEEIGRAFGLDEIGLDTVSYTHLQRRRMWRRNLRWTCSQRIMDL